MREHDRKLILSRIWHRAYDTRRDVIELSQLVEKAMQQEMNRRTETANDEIGSTDDEEKRIFLEAVHEDSIEQVSETFTRIQRYALFTTAMSTYERNFVLLCHAVKALFPVSPTFDDRKPGVIQRAVNYLEKQVDISIIREKDRILSQDLVSIRNCIVHRDGRIADLKDSKKIQEFISRIPTIEITNSVTVKLLPGFVENMTHSMHLMFERLFQKLKEKTQTDD